MDPRILNENSPEWTKWLHAEAKWVREQEDEPGPNRTQLEELLETWRLNRPQMWKRLRGRVLALPLAVVLQDRFWKEVEQLERAGLPPTDAMEQAMADWLLMEPEDSEEPEPTEPMAAPATMPR
jgi:hypothetical protein